MDRSEQYLVSDRQDTTDDKKASGMDRQRIHKLQRAQIALEENNLDQVQEDLEWLDLHKKLQEFNLKSSPGKWAPFVIGFACMLLFALSLQPVSSSKIQLDMMVSGLEFRLADTWAPSVSFHPQSAFFASISEVDAGNRRVETGTEASVEVQARQLDLNLLPLPKDTKVRLFKNGSELRMMVAPGPLSAEVHVNDGRFSLSQPSWDTTLADVFPSSFSLKAQSNNTAISWAWQDSLPYLLRDIPIYEPAFHQQVRSGSFVSTILSGTIQLLSSGDSYELEEGEILKLLSRNAFSIRKLQILSEGFKVTTELEVSELASGPPGFEQSLMPSWLMYFSKDQGFKYIWLALGWLWTFLWSVKRTIF